MRKLNLMTHGKSRSLFGQRLQQSFQSLYVLDKIIQNNEFKSIVELGYGSGILTTYLATCCALSKNVCKLWSIDIKDFPHVRLLADIGGGLATTIKADIYAEETIERMTENLNSGKQSLLICDGLDPKSREIELYAPYLKKSTIIMAHDFVTNPDKPARWCFTKEQVPWDLVEPYQPYYDLSAELDTRMGCFIKT